MKSRTLIMDCQRPGASPSHGDAAAPFVFGFFGAVAAMVNLSMFLLGADVGSRRVEPEQLARVLRDDELLVGWNCEHRHAARRRRDPRRVGGVRGFVERNAQPFRRRGYSPANLRRPL